MEIRVCVGLRDDGFAGSGQQGTAKVRAHSGPDGCSSLWIGWAVAPKWFLFMVALGTRRDTGAVGLDGAPYDGISLSCVDESWQRPWSHQHSDPAGHGFLPNFCAGRDTATPSREAHRERKRVGDLSHHQSKQIAKAHGETFLMMDLLRDLWDFMRERKKFWLAPILIILLVFGMLMVLTQGSVVAPFIYTLF